MRIGLLSDLHLSVAPLDFPEIDADVLVLAGDLHRPAKAMEWARNSRLPTLYVAGNHEFYGSDLETTYRDLRAHAAGSRVRVLERSEWHHEGVRFLGCTLWSDYRLYDSVEARDKAILELTKFSRDFQRIRTSPDFPQLFTPAVSQLIFEQSVSWLGECFARAHEGPTVVITHFAPTKGSISPKYVGSPFNGAFVSDLEAKLLEWQPALWLHGHMHDSFDYRVGKTRVVCNPRGYVPGGKAENPKFDPHLVVEV